MAELEDSVRTRRARAAAQLLGPREERTPEEVVGHLLAVQAQDLRAAGLALRARGSGFVAADVAAALDDGRLIRSWLLRGTLHLVRADDWPWLFALTGTLPAATSARRLPQLGVTPEMAERAVDVAREVLTDGPSTRAALGERFADEGIVAEGRALPHLVLRCAMERVLVCGAGDDVRAAPELPEVDAEAALAELGRRYLAAHAPAAPEDLAAWSGVGLRLARRALAHVEVDPAAAGEPLPARLLGPFDELFLGWKDRSFAVPPGHAKLVHPGGGMLRAVAIDDGLVAGSWDAGPREEHTDVERFLAGSG